MRKKYLKGLGYILNIIKHYFCDFIRLFINKKLYARYTEKYNNQKMSQPENTSQLFKIIKQTADALPNGEHNFKEGRWEKEEKIRFIKSCLMFGNDWKKVIYTI